MSRLRFYGVTSTARALDSRYIEAFRWRAGASIESNRWPSFADSRGRLVLSTRMPGLTATRIASWRYIEVRLGVTLVLWRCAIASYGLGRGARTYELELQSLSSYRLVQGANFLEGATSRTLAAYNINPATGFTYFDHKGRQTQFARGLELLQNIERFAFCMILPQPTADGFDLWGLPFTSTTPAIAPLTPTTYVIPESSFHTAIRDWRRDQAVMNQRVETQPPEQTIRWSTDWDRTTYFQVGGKWTHRLDFGLFLRSRGENRPIVDIDDDRGDLRFNPPISGSYGLNALPAQGRIFVSGLSQRLRGKVTVTVEYKVGRTNVTARPQTYGTVVGVGLGRVEPSRIFTSDKASNISAALGRLNTFRPRVYSFTALPDISPGNLWTIRPGYVLGFVGAGISDRCLVVRSEIAQRGNRPAQLRLAMVRLGPYVSPQRGEGTPVLYGSRAVRYAGDIGYTIPPLLQYGGRTVRYAETGVTYD